MAGSRTLKLSILADVDDLKKSLNTGSNEVEGFGSKVSDFSKKAAVAFAAASAAAVAYAGKLAIDGVKAAIEDQAAQEKLANALKNVTGATEEQIGAVEDQITKMSLAFGVADDKLRPAFQRLATATGDLDQANKGLTLALDISAATGKSVEAVSNALGKAYEGNTSALGRLGIGLSSAELKSMTLEQVTAKLADTFGGAATTQANTFQGRIDRMKIAFDEAKEGIGTAFLPILDKLLTFVNDKIVPAIMAFSNMLSGSGEGLGEKFGSVSKTIKDIFGPIIEGSMDTIGRMVALIKTNAVPVIEAMKDAWDKISGALANQKENLLNFYQTFKQIYDWIIAFVVPLIRVYLVTLFNNLGTVIAKSLEVILPMLSNIMDQVKTNINTIIRAINVAIRGVNLIKSGPDIPYIPLIGEDNTPLGSGMTFEQTGFASAGTSSTNEGDGGFGLDLGSPLSLPEGGAGTGTGIGTGTGTGTGGGTGIGAGTGTSGGAGTGTGTGFTSMPVVPEPNYNVPLPVTGVPIPGTAGFVGPYVAPEVTINVMGPSIIDSESFQREIVTALNLALARGTAGPINTEPIAL